MAHFTYRALDAGGSVVTGQIEAGSKGEVYRQLESTKLVPVEVRDAAPSDSAKTSTGEGGAPRDVPKLKRAQVIHFTEELADLLDSGVQLPQALGILSERQRDARIRAVAGHLRYQLREGLSFAAALKKCRPSFNDLYCNLVAAGEASGSLPQVLQRLAANLAQLHDLQSKVAQAAIYPAFMLGSCFLLVAVFLTVLVPQLASLLASSGKELPLVTRVLVASSNWTIAHWWLFPALLALVLGGAWLIRSQPAGRVVWDRSFLRLPLAGPIVDARFHAGFAHAMGNLLHNGVPLLQALRLMHRATPNLHFQRALQTVIDDVAGGATLTRALRKTRAFSPSLEDVAAIGEQTGHLGKSLEKASGRFDKELDKRIKRLTAMLTPVILIFLAGVVTVVAYSIVTGIFESVNSLRSRG